MSSPAQPLPPGDELPAVDVRLVAPENRYEIHDGRLVYVPPADEPHGSCHATLSALLAAHVAHDWTVAIDMLTRTGETNDIAPDASVYPRARDPQTGGRQLEALAFEVVSTQRLADAAAKAQRLTERGVRRVFAVDVARQRAFEWSARLQSWEILAVGAAITDHTLCAPLPIDAVVQLASAEDAIVRALLIKGNRVLTSTMVDASLRGEAKGRAEGEAKGRAEGILEGRARALLCVLEARGLAVLPSERARILGERDLGAVDRWLQGVARAESVAELLRDR